MAGNSIGGMTIGVGINSSPLTAGIKTITSSLSGLGGTIKSIGGGLATGIGGALPGAAAFLALSNPVTAFGAAMGLATVVGLDFGKKMAELKAITQPTAEEFETLKAAAKDLGAQGVFGPSEVADAMISLGQAGLKAHDVLRTLPSVLDFAAAGGMELGATADLVVNTLSQFGLQTAEAARTADVMTAAAIGSTTTVSEMGLAMSYVGNVASAAGMDIEQTSAALMAMAQAGLRGERGGTGLRGVLAAMADPSKEVRGEMNRLGLSFVDAVGNMKGLPRIADEFRAAIGGMATGEQSRIVNAIFGNVASPAFLALMKQGSAGMLQFEGDLRKSMGTAASTAREQGDNTLDAMTRMINSVKVLGIEIFEAFDPILRPIVDGIASLVRHVTPTIKELAGSVFGFLGRVGQTAYEMAKMFFTRIASVVAPLIGDISAVFGPLISDANGSFTGFLNGVKAAFGKLLDFVTPVWKAMVGFARGAFASITQIVKALFGSDVVQGGAATIKAAWESIVGFVKPIIEWLRDFMVKAWIAAEFGIRNFPQIVELAFRTVQVTVLNFLDFAGAVFSANLPKIAAYIGAVFERVFDAVVAFGRSRFKDMLLDAGEWAQAFAAVLGGKNPIPLIQKLFGDRELSSMQVDLSNMPKIFDEGFGKMTENARARLDELKNDLGPKWDNFFAQRWAQVFMPENMGKFGPFDWLVDKFNLLFPGGGGGALEEGRVEEDNIRFEREGGGFGGWAGIIKAAMDAGMGIANISDTLPGAITAGTSEAVSIGNRWRLDQASLDPQREGVDLQKQANQKLDQMVKGVDGVEAAIKNLPFVVLGF